MEISEKAPLAAKCSILGMYEVRHDVRGRSDGGRGSEVRERLEFHEACGRVVESSGKTIELLRATEPSDSSVGRAEARQRYVVEVMADVMWWGAGDIGEV